MVCYICENAASFCCPNCRRYVCNRHTETADFSGSIWADGLFNTKTGLMCGSCRTAVQKSSEKGMREHYWCDFCGANTEEGTKRCDVCKKQFCKKHGVSIYGGEFSSDKHHCHAHKK